MIKYFGLSVRKTDSRNSIHKKPGITKAKHAYKPKTKIFGNVICRNKFGSYSQLLYLQALLRCILIETYAKRGGF